MGIPYCSHIIETRFFQSIWLAYWRAASTDTPCNCINQNESKGDKVYWSYALEGRIAVNILRFGGFWTVCEQKSCHCSEKSLSTFLRGDKLKQFWEWGLGLPLLLAEQSHSHQDKHQCCVACTKASWAEGQCKSDKASSWTAWALCFSKSEHKCQIPYKYQSVHSCTDLALLFWSAGWESRVELFPHVPERWRNIVGLHLKSNYLHLPPSLKRWITLFLAWWRMCLVSTGGNSGKAWECQACRHNTGIGKSAWIALERGNVGCKWQGSLLTQTTDPSLWNVRPLSPKIVFCLLSPCMIHGIFSLLLCVLQCNWKRACAVHTEKLS